MMRCASDARTGDGADGRFWRRVSASRKRSKRCIVRACWALIIPEFGNLYARVLHDLYHIYTVDRHSLAAVRELERLRAGEFKDPIRC